MRYLLALFLPIALSAVCLDDLCVDEVDLLCYEPYVRGEVLYWRPSGVPFDFAYPAKPEGVIKPHTLKPINHFGWRLAAGLVEPDGCWFGELSALVLRSDDKKFNNARLGEVIPPFGLPETARVQGQLVYDYWNGQLLLARNIHDGELASFHVAGLVRYACLTRRQRTISQSFLEKLEPVLVDGEEQLDRDGKKIVKKVHQTIDGVQSYEKSQYWGVGPGIGLGGWVDICGGFAFRGHLYGFALGGQNRHESAAVGALEMRLALTYEQDVDCYDCRLELGYEMHRYFTPFRVTNPWLAGVNRRDSSIGFSGPTLSLRVGF